MAKAKSTKQNELVSGQAPYDTPATKSDHIRAYMRKHRSKQQRRPKVIVDHLAEHGIEVKPELVSHVKQNPLKGRKKAGRPKASSEKKTSGSRSSAQKAAWRKRKRQDAQVDALVAAKQLLNAVNGDREKAAECLDTIEKINALP